MFLKKLLQVGQSANRTPMMKPNSLLKQPAFRKFSTGQMPPTSSGSSAMSILGIGASVAGFIYLGSQIRSMNAHKQAYMAQGHTFMSPLVQSRLAKTFGWFSFGIMNTAATCYLLRSSSIWMAVPWWAHLVGSLAFMAGAHVIDYDSMMPLKALCYSGFAGMMGLAILPLIQISSAAMVADAALVTGLSMSSLAGIAYLAPSEQFLNWGGALSMACTAMFAVSVAGMFFPQSRALYNVWLWGGLGLTGCLTLYNTQQILYMAKNQARFDPLGSSIGIYMNAINFFIRILMIMQGSKRK